jgi:hypothetical protein
MSDDLSFDVKVAIQRAVLFHPLFEGTAANALEIAITAIKAGDEIRASSPAQETVTTEPDDIVWSCVNSEPFEYAIQQGPHGDEFVKLINGKCLRRSCAPLLAIPAPPQPGRDAIIEECAQAIMSLRQSGATIFDAKHSGQRGEDRSTALHDAIDVVRALTGEPK